MPSILAHIVLTQHLTSHCIGGKHFEQFQTPPITEEVPDKTWDQDSVVEGAAIGKIAASKTAAGNESVASKSLIEGPDMITKNGKEKKFPIEINGDHSGDN